MRLKSYFVHSVEEAIQRAKNELGAEAMLVDTKALSAQPGNRARVEVIFAAPTQSPAPPPIVTSPATSPATIPDSSTMQRFRGGLTNLLDALSELPGNGRLADFERSNPVREWLEARMIEAEVPARMIRRYTSHGPAINPNSGTPAAEASAFLAAQVPQTATAFADHRRIALCGPAGSGKTTATAKLAYKLGLEKGIAPLVVSLDNVKIGAADQLSRLCRLLGVAFQPIENFGDLRLILDENVHRRLILIDTPGLYAGDPDLAVDLAESMNGAGGIERHLVVPASPRYGTLESWFALAAPLSIDHLLFTRLDETDLYGPMWSLAASRKLPLSWVSIGPRIPEDIESASVTQFCDAIAGCQAPPPPPRAIAASAGATLS